VASLVAVGVTRGGVGVGDGDTMGGVASSGRRQAESDVNSNKLHNMTLAFTTVLLLQIELFYIGLPYLASEGYGPEVAKSVSLW